MSDFSTNLIKRHPRKIVDVFPKICRVCLGLGELHSLLEDENTNKFQSISQIEVHENDNFPTNICENCLQRLNAASQFMEECKTSQEFLKEIVEEAEKQEKWDHSYSAPRPNGVIQKIITVKNAPQEISFEHIDLNQLLSTTDTAIAVDDFNSLVEKASNPNELAKFDQVRIVYKKRENEPTNVRRRFDPEFRKHWKCSLCSLVFDNGYREFQKHLQTHKPYECKDCAVTFMSAVSLRKHLDVVHRKVKNYQCEFCGETFLTSLKLGIHINRHKLQSQRSPKICSYCGESFQNDYVLKIHLMIHDGSYVRNEAKLAPKLCHLCGKNVSFYHFNKHVKKHYGITVSKCHKRCPYCYKAFPANRYRKHVRVHTGNKPYRCKLCPKAFLTNQKYKDHLVLHSGEKRHDCTYCGKKFALRKYLREHLLVHVEDGCNACSSCGKNFRRRGLLRQHLKKTHARQEQKSESIYT